MTRCWLLGMVGVMVLWYCKLFTYLDVVYTWDLAIQRRQYMRIIYSLFDIGPLGFSNIFSGYLVLTRIQAMEESIADKKRFITKLLGILIGIILLSKYILLMDSLGMVLSSNIWYYTIKKNANVAVRIGGRVEINQIWIPVISYTATYFSTGCKLYQLLPFFLPGHTLYFFDDVISKTYGINI